MDDDMESKGKLEVCTHDIENSSSASNIVNTPTTAATVFTAAKSKEEEESVSSFLQLYVKHSVLITFLHLAFALLCSVFALPFFSLSNPSAGLRLREDGYADRGDGFYAAASQLVPPGFGSGISGESVQTKFPERTLAASPLILYWYTKNASDNVFKYASVMHELEMAIWNAKSYQTQLCRLDQALNACMRPHSPTTLLFNSSDPAAAFSQLFSQDKFFFPASAKELTKVDLFSTPMPYTRVQVHIGAPLAGFAALGDRDAAQQTVLYDALKLEVLPLIQRAMDSAPPEIRLTYFQDKTRSIEATDILMHDLTFASLAVTVVFLSLWWHFYSLALAFGAILQVLVSFPITLFFYRLMLGIKLFGGLHVISIFLIIGIGVDDCFVLFDAYEQVTRKDPRASLAVRLQHSYKIARFAMSATSLTTFLCFISLANCAIPVLKWFGVFCAMLILVNYILCITLFLGIICIYDRFLFRHAAYEPKTPLGEHIMITYLAQTLIKHAWRRNAILIFSVGFILAMTIFASRLGPSKSIDSFYSDGHPFREQEEIVNTGFVGDVGHFATARYVNGLKHPFRVDYDFAVDSDFGTPVYDEAFNLADPQVQTFLVKQCEDMMSELNSTEAELAALYSTQVGHCPLNKFKAWLEAKSIPFPMRDEREFDFRLLEYMLQPNDAGFQFGFVANNSTTNAAPFRARLYFTQFPTTRSQRLESHEDRLRVWAAWDALAARQGPKPAALGADGSTHAVDGQYDVWMATQSVLLSNSIQSISFSLGVALVVLFAASNGDIALAFSGTFTLASSVSCTLGTMYLLGWSLGAVEAVSATILCGIAVDYNIHLSVAFAECTGATTRYERVENAMRMIGMSVFYGATTTLFASSFLLLCTISILNRFGQFMIMVVAYSLFFAFFTQMSLLSLDFLPSSAVFKRATDWAEHRLASITPLPLVWWRNMYVVFLLAWVVLVLAVGLTYSGLAKPQQTGLEPRLEEMLQQDYLAAQTFDEFAPGKWTQVVVPGSRTGCAKLNSAYSFFVYVDPNAAASGDNVVVVEFEGRANAVCFSSDTCRDAGRTFSSAIDVNRFRRINAGAERFHFTMGDDAPPRVQVYLPYCTGDAFLGNVTVAYDDFVTMQHLGEANARAALEFVQRVSAARQDLNFVLQGCGAGAIGALAHAQYLPATRVSVIADSMVFVDQFQAWAHSVWQSTLPLFNYASLTSNLPSGRLLVVSSAYDWFQARFYGFGQNRASFRTSLESSTDVYPFLRLEHGDRHCAVLNPVGDRDGRGGIQDESLREIVSQMYHRNLGGLPIPPIPNAAFYSKCLGDACKLDADLRT